MHIEVYCIINNKYISNLYITQSPIVVIVYTHLLYTYTSYNAS